jgi:hypothetical protein
LGALWKLVWRVLKKLRIELPYNPGYTLEGYCGGTCTPMFIAALFTIAKLWNKLRCPSTDKWLKKR